jgi:class 3 adenylate cyclase/tetratricopeptide (TPR) repeat protein
VPTCANCGRQNPPGFRFCGACGAALAGARPQPAEERKVVTVLFCDLVGFTARSDHADPEDVGAMLRPYHARLRREIERLGGTLDKFIGDAVMAVFGAPVAHEDDPERAVRCALRMLQAITELNQDDPALALQVRIGVNTGEALVTLGPDNLTEKVVGDVVNTASRLQGVAPAGGVVVGEPTWRATRTLFDHERLDAVRVKGKAEPLPVWRVTGTRSRLGVDPDARPVTPFVGREQQLEQLRGRYRQALDERAVQLVNVLGEPGVGKSRLVHELLRHVDAEERLVSWRQASCPPYGEGITFWALGEIVKAQAGILESDLPQEVAGKLAAAVEAVADDQAEREWLKNRLAPLVGLAGDDAARADRAESFTAWRRFLEAVAATGPLVCVVEDLHWADPALVGFLEHLVDTSTGVALLLVTTARPEVLDRHPGWGGRRPNATTLTLPPLTDRDTAELVAAMLGQPVLPAEVQSLLLERAGGNPLYAEEFVRLLTDRRLLLRHGRTLRLAPEADLAVPETLHALIAARLDTLPPHRKALLQDACVFGKAFWAGALAAMGALDEHAVRAELRQLERTRLVRPVSPPSLAGQAEYAFSHALVKDVAYRQVPRAGRARRHRAAAEWLQDVAPERVADHAGVIAHHYRQALALYRASGAPAGQLGELEPPTRRFLALAGDRALALDVASAQAYFAEALELCPPDHPERGGLLARTARATFQSGRPAEAAQGYEAAIAAFARTGDLLGEGEALDRLCAVLWNQGETRRAGAALARGIELLERGQPGKELCSAYAQMAAGQVMAGHPEDALAWADKALALADRLGGLPEQELRALDARGMARVDLGDPGALDDLREALRIGLETGAGFDTAVVYNNMVEPVWVGEGPAAALETVRAGTEFAQHRGLAEATTWLRTTSLGPLFDLGRWDQVVELADQVVAHDRDGGGRYVAVWAQVLRTHVLVHRGQRAGARELVAELLPAAREIDDLQVLVPALAAAALVEQADGRPAAAVRLVADLQALTGDRDGGHWYRAQYLTDLARLCVAAGTPSLGQELLEATRTAPARHRHAALSARAVLAEARGEVEEAAGLYHRAERRWAQFGHALERGHALLGGARCLLRLDPPAAPPKLRAAQAVFAGLGAHPLADEADGWLVDATA